MKKIVIFIFALIVASSLFSTTSVPAQAAYDTCLEDGDSCCEAPGGVFVCNVKNHSGLACNQSTKKCYIDDSIEYARSDPFCGDYIGLLNITNGVNTAFGCIRLFDENILSGEGADYSVFLSWILTWAIGLGGGIAFLLIIYAGFMIMTSSGDPERLKAGQELLTSAIMGLIMLIFSMFILEFIGVDILDIPGFGT